MQYAVRRNNSIGWWMLLALILGMFPFILYRWYVGRLIWLALECVACGVLFLLIADRSVKLRLVFEIVVVTCAAQPKTCDDEYCTQEHSNELGAVYNECQEADGWAGDESHPRRMVRERRVSAAVSRRESVSCFTFHHGFTLLHPWRCDRYDVFW